jgi:hypothetical protein
MHGENISRVFRRSKLPGAGQVINFRSWNIFLSAMRLKQSGLEGQNMQRQFLARRGYDSREAACHDSPGQAQPWVRGPHHRASPERARYCLKNVFSN